MITFKPGSLVLFGAIMLLSLVLHCWMLIERTEYTNRAIIHSDSILRAFKAMDLQQTIRRDQSDARLQSIRKTLDSIQIDQSFNFNHSEIK